VAQAIIFLHFQGGRESLLTPAMMRTENGVAPSYQDPARYSFTHGGKDGIPYPVDRKTYDQSIELLSRALGRAKLGLSEKNEARGRLDRAPARIGASLKTGRMMEMTGWSGEEEDIGILALLS
jgi:hypothetical protein